MDIWIFYALFPLAYLLGSVNTSIVLSKLVYREDIRSFGSKNAGMTNMMRTYGKKIAAVVLLCDMLKGVLVVVLGKLLLPETLPASLVSLLGFVVILGHIFPVFFKFRGGKGVATTAGVMLALQPLYFGILLVLFVIILAASKYMSLTSITAAILYPVITFAGAYFFSYSTYGQGAVALLIGATVVYTHRENIKRLLHGEENRFQLKRKPAGN